jgi:BASS family bile acid:Na+ symporter
MLLALSPVPPVLPGKQMKAGGSADYVLGLFIISAAVAIVTVPAGVEVIGRIFGRELVVPLGTTARVVGTSVLLPALAGLALGHAAPTLAARIAAPLSKVSTGLLVALLVPVVIMGWDRLLVHVGNYTILVIVLFVAAGLLTGHLLGGPRTEDRAALALATASRHPGVALAVLHAVAPEAGDVAPVVVLYLLVAAMASPPYLAWCRRAGPSKARS